ncbi:hypothetical protein C8J57DRAFT_1300409, partial [Mycena rebaudengoi]
MQPSQTVTSLILSLLLGLCVPNVASPDAPNTPRLRGAPRCHVTQWHPLPHTTSSGPFSAPPNLMASTYQNTDL